MIVFDIEWNHGCDDIPLDEILQIGAVRLDRLGGKITEVFNAHIRPRVHKELGVMAREVLDMETFSRAKWDFSTALAAFRRWCGDERVFAAWGNSDLEVLRRNCAYWKVPAPVLDEVYDIQESFSAILGSRQRIALYRAVEYCGIPDCLDCHSALNDAVYTAIIGEWIPESALLLCAPPRRIQRLSKAKFPLQPRRRVGPFPSLEAALNARESRRVACPQCGRTVSVSSWSYEFPRQYYADFCCPEHGWHICRLTLSPWENGTWRGRLTVPTVTPTLLREFHAATKSKHFICTTNKRKRVRRRSARRSET